METLTPFAMKIVHAQCKEMTGVLEIHDRVMPYAGEYAQIQLVQANAISHFDQRDYTIVSLPLPANKVYVLPLLHITKEMCQGVMPNMQDLLTLVDMYVKDFQQSQLKPPASPSICTSELAFSICDAVRHPIGEELMGFTNIQLVDIATDKGHAHKETAAAVLMLRMFSDEIDGHLANMETIPC